MVLTKWKALVTGEHQYFKSSTSLASTQTAVLPDGLHILWLFACGSVAISTNSRKDMAESSAFTQAVVGQNQNGVWVLPGEVRLLEVYFLQMEGASMSGVTWQCRRPWVSPKLLLSLKVKARKAPCLAGEISAAQTGEVLVVIKSLETVSSCESMFESRICSIVISRALKRF